MTADRVLVSSLNIKQNPLRALTRYHWVAENNKVKASSRILAGNTLGKAKALAEVLRLYRIRTYLAVNFSSFMKLDGLQTSDPLNAEVIK